MTLSDFTYHNALRQAISTSFFFLESQVREKRLICKNNSPRSTQIYIRRYIVNDTCNCCQMKPSLECLLSSALMIPDNNWRWTLSPYTVSGRHNPLRSDQCSSTVREAGSCPQHRLPGPVSLLSCHASNDSGAGTDTAGAWKGQRWKW